MTELMRPNPVRARLQAGGTAYGTMAFEFFTPGLMAILADAGADFVLLDTEHSGVGIETIKTQIAASRGLGIVPMVRVPGCHYHLIAPVLDAGAMGIMVPMIETPVQAQQPPAYGNDDLLGSHTVEYSMEKLMELQVGQSKIEGSLVIVPGVGGGDNSIYDFNWRITRLPDADPVVSPVTRLHGSTPRE